MNCDHDLRLKKMLGLQEKFAFGKKNNPIQKKNNRYVHVLGNSSMKTTCHLKINVFNIQVIKGN